MKNSGDKIIRQQVDTMQVSFDKEAAWMRLQDRLESKDEKKTPFRWQWAAAAALLLAAGLWYGAQGPAENTIAVQQATPDISQPVATPMHTNTEAPQLIVNDPVTPPPAKTNAITTDRNLTKDHAPVQENNSIAETVEPPIAMEEATPTEKNTPPPVAAATPKLEVLHINTVVEEEKRERAMRNSRYAAEKINYDEIFEDPMIPKNPFKIYISRQN